MRKPRYAAKQVRDGVADAVHHRLPIPPVPIAQIGCRNGAADVHRNRYGMECRSIDRKQLFRAGNADRQDPGLARIEVTRGTRQEWLHLRRSTAAALRKDQQRLAQRKTLLRDFNRTARRARDIPRVHHGVLARPLRALRHFDVPKHKLESGGEIEYTFGRQSPSNDGHTAGADVGEQHFDDIRIRVRQMIREDHERLVPRLEMVSAVDNGTGCSTATPGRDECGAQRIVRVIRQSVRRSSARSANRWRPARSSMARSTHARISRESLARSVQKPDDRLDERLTPARCAAVFIYQARPGLTTADSGHRSSKRSKQSCEYPS